METGDKQTTWNPYDNTDGMDHQERYDKWASTYDKDVARQNTQAHDYMTSFFTELVENNKITVKPDETRILDVGCGTGIMGKLFSNIGCSHIDGIDYSQNMVEEARKLGLYKTLIGHCDIREPAPFFFHGQYDLSISLGVFTRDMVFPESLKYMIEVTKNGGYLLLSTRMEWTEKYNFEDFYKQMEALGHISLVEVRKGAPYLVTINAHYWVFEVLDNNVTWGKQ